MSDLETVDERIKYFESVKLESTMHRVVQKILEDPRLLAGLNILLDNITYQQKICGHRWYRTYITRNFFLDKCTFRVTSGDVNDYENLMRDYDPALRTHKVDALLANSRDRFHRILMETLTDKINQAGYHAKYYLVLAFIRVR